MNIKEKIGSRIATIRKERGLTVKELSSLTKHLKSARISNWEHGYRSPGPEEALQLANALAVSPAYLLCLTDDIHLGKSEKTGKSTSRISLLDHEQAANAISSIKNIKESNQKIKSKHPFISVDPKHSQMTDENSFALTIKNDSMEPKIKTGDLVIINMDKKPIPGDLIAIKLKSDPNIIIRQYKQISYSNSFEAYELIALNSNWANIEIKKKNDCQIIGCVIEIRHYC